MEILILILLTLLNGFFALSEIALVSVRKNRIEQLARQGNNKAKTVLKLLQKPEDFLSAVQVGITLIGIVAGAYAGTALADDVRPMIEKIPGLAEYADNLSFTLVIAIITYFSIVIGELLPKTLALGNAEKIALAVAPVIQVFTLVTLPLVRLLSASTNFIIKIFRLEQPAEDKLSEEELRQLLKTAGKQGVLEKQQSEFHQNLFQFVEQRAKSLQTYRKDLEWIDINAPLEKITALVRNSVHSKFPVSDGSSDNILGVLNTKDFYEYLLNPDAPLESILRKPIYISETMLAGAILNLFKKEKQYLGVVVDEFGAVEGIVTLHDLLEGIVGDLPDLDELNEPQLIKRSDGSYLADGALPVRELNKCLDREVIKRQPESYLTVAGFIAFVLGRVPSAGEKFSFTGFEFEVVDMDGFKIDKVLIKRLKPDGENEASEK